MLYILLFCEKGVVRPQVAEIGELVGIDHAEHRCGVEDYDPSKHSQDETEKSERELKVKRKQ